MKITLSNALAYINQNLNYPGLRYEDISSFFDLAIADLNTSLHIAIPSVSSMREAYGQSLSKLKENCIRITNPNETIPVYDSESDVHDDVTYYYNASTREYGLKRNDTYVYYNELYALYVNNGICEHYVTLLATLDDCVWIKDVTYDLDELDLTTYLSEDWIILWLIPYICFKYSCRDGGTANTFAEEFTQGFSQLQNAYDVPHTVVLNSVAGREAYKEDVLQNIKNLKVSVTTKAIFEDMKHARAVTPIFEESRGGWFND